MTTTATSLCPSCGSENVSQSNPISNGLRKRYYCRDCKKQWEPSAPHRPTRLSLNGSTPRAGKPGPACPERAGAGHWWLITTPRAGRATSKALCRDCGARREFRNDLYDELPGFGDLGTLATGRAHGRPVR